ncbi:MAG: hypothetical protein H7Y11_11850 [Armatimonadetes bacterium]|nr:hypothetical protein [Anaerolineae bacterium]
MAINSLLDETVQRAGRRQIRWGLVGIALLVLAHIPSVRYYYNFFLGPFPITEDDLLALDDPNSRQQYYVNATGEAAYDSGYAYVNRPNTGIETVEQSYAALELDDRWLLVMVAGSFADADKLPISYTGALTPFTDSIQTEVIDDTYRQVPGLRGIYLPYMLNTHDFKNEGYLGLSITAIVGALCGLGVINGLATQANPQRHPVYQALALFGEPHVIAQQIDAELQGSTVRVGDLHFTRHWLVIQRRAMLQVTRYQDIMWAYKKVAQGRATGKNFMLHIYDRHGKLLMLTAQELEATEMINTVATHAPWALIGYSEETETMWDQQRAQFIATVDTRRANPET